MPSLLWTGRLTFPMRVLVDINNILAFILGNATDQHAMKSRVKAGYEGRFSPHVQRYDELGVHLQEKAADAQLEGVDLRGQSVLDVGCGTGVLALKALALGARAAFCGDISMLMMLAAKRKAPSTAGHVHFAQLDADSLPFADNQFDAALSGMTFGLLPDQLGALREMVRVVKPGGIVCIGAHGPEHYWEAVDGCFRCIGKRRILGYRLEFWPRSEAYLLRLAESCGLHDLHGHRAVWKTRFPSGEAMYDFFSAISASWWYAKFPPSEAQRDSDATRAYFGRKRLDTITDDVVTVWGRKNRSPALVDQ
jgi:SAM-dependent methyltransferase